jgi:hypothetical protein
MDLSDKPMSTKGEQSPGFGQDLKSTSDKPALLRPAGRFTITIDINPGLFLYLVSNHPIFFGTS